MYVQLAVKEKNAALREVFCRLADNERATGNRIQAELKCHERNSACATPGWVINVATFLFKVVPRSLILVGLKKTLDRGMFRRWYEDHHAHHPVFWETLLDHEKLQKDLLKAHWG